MRLMTVIIGGCALLFVILGQAIIDWIPLLFVSLALSISMGFVFLGELIIDYIPSIKRFRETHQAWGSLVIDSQSIVFQLNPRLLDLGQFRFEEVSRKCANNHNIYELVRHKRFGDIIATVTYKERDLRHLTKEMRVYCFLYLSLFTIGILTNIEHFHHKPLAEMGKAVLSHHVIPVLEIIMIVWLLIRLAVETQSVNSLLEGE